MHCKGSQYDVRCKTHCYVSGLRQNIAPVPSMFSLHRCISTCSGILSVLIEVNLVGNVSNHQE
ncbi:hypothetical protein OIDMADRAFT_20275 [Oidiodendron maius Zn]|uniref:Uncharacterized protein n=1 Tax=Oidiodendron maius (strain Zn) TaxID=913774 RepID=A0A0C3CFV3_OIDMZ|nr:hypothetical protein OIDMADRAFT_20275 [Oidiodendron maius Zn]